MELILVKSDNIHAVGYNPEEQILRILFKTGITYDYLNVPKAIYSALLASTSKGQFFHKHIKPRYKAIRL